MNLVRDRIRELLPQPILDLHRWFWRWRKNFWKNFIVKQFHKIYYHSLIFSRNADLIFSANWFGVPVIKCPLDCWIYQEIIFRTQPEIIVETGVCLGGSTLYFASILDLVGKGRIIGIDLELSNVNEKVKSHPRITLIQGNSVDPFIIEEVKQQCKGLRTMVVLDSDHHAEHVLKELIAYGELVTQSCYLVCEDTNINGNPVYSPVPFNPGPKEALDVFLKDNSGKWQVDKTCEKFFMSCNPGGYLLRR